MARIQALYDRGLSRQAYDLASASVPFKQVRGVDTCILMGRIALNLGAGRLAFGQHLRAYRLDPKRTRSRAYYLEAFLAMRGPAGKRRTQVGSTATRPSRQFRLQLEQVHGISPCREGKRRSERLDAQVGAIRSERRSRNYQSVRVAVRWAASRSGCSKASEN